MMSQSPFIPYGRQTVTSGDIAAVVECLRSPFLTQGPVVPTFEQAVASKVDATFAVAVNSATSALHLACLALGLGDGDSLWTSPISFVASANCGRYCGANVDFVDIDPKTGLISIDALALKLEIAEVQGTLPRILIPVHLAGTSCDMKAIEALSTRYGFSIIEDASHAIGGRFQDQLVGNCKHSSITVFSFHPVKIITTGEGGLATTNSPLLARRMAELRSHGIVRDINRFELPPAGPWVYEQQHLGFNYRLTDIQAALGLSQLERLDKIVSIRNSLFRRYINIFSDLPVRFLEVPNDVYSSFHLAIIRLDDISAIKHCQVFEELRKDGIGVQLHYSPIHLQPYYRQLGFSEGDFPEAEAYAKSSFSLPLYPGLSQKDQQLVSTSLISALL